ncbi:hypothetical protein OH492_25365 [Vibrio chagasii]|nr:hypothetical protein [Vibrio chagasii]
MQSNDAPVIGTVTACGCGRSDGRHQLEHGRHTDDRDDDAGEAGPSRRKPTRQAHTARSKTSN